MLRLCFLFAVFGASIAFKSIDETLLNKIELSFNRYDTEINKLVAENQQLKAKLDTLTDDVKAQHDDMLELKVQAVEQRRVNSAQGREIEILKKILATYTTSSNDASESESDINPSRWDDEWTSTNGRVVGLQHQSRNTVARSSKRSLQRNTRLLLDTESVQTYPEPGYVAFTAKLNAHMTGLGHQQAILFEDIETNQGGAYSANTGAFTAPMNGTFFFTATIMSHNGQYLETEMVVNGNEVVYMYSADTKYEQGTNSAVLILKQNDEVWVRHRMSEGDQVFGASWSSFSGFLLHA